MTKHIPPVFIINMPKDTDRRAIMQKRLDEANINGEFIDAINGRAMAPQEIVKIYDSNKRKRYFGRDMTAGEIGCLLSHQKIYEKIVAENIPAAIILEDDVIFENDFKEAINGMMNTSIRWDVIRFLGSEKIYKRGCRKILPIKDTRYVFARLPTAPGGAHGYLIRNTAAKIMIKHMQHNWMPIDTLQGRSWETGLETLVLYPAPLYPDLSTESTIGNDERFDKTITLTGLERHLYPLTRTWFKLCENIGKRWIYWGAWPRDYLCK